MTSYHPSEAARIPAMDRGSSSPRSARGKHSQPCDHRGRRAACPTSTCGAVGETGGAKPSCAPFLVPTAQWHAWAESEAFSDALTLRMANLGLEQPSIAALLEVGRRGEEWLVYQEAAWFTYAVLDAATRMVSAFVEAGGVPRGCGAEWWLRAIIAQVLYDRAPEAIPTVYWSVQTASPRADGTPQVQVHGNTQAQFEGWDKIAA